MLRIRLRRMGSTHAPFYRVVVSDSRRTPRGGRPVDTVGYFNPSPTQVKLDLARLDEWLAKGARPSDAVAGLIRKERARLAATSASA